MKRIILIGLVIFGTLNVSVWAQSASVLQTFENGLKAANKGEFEKSLKQFQSAFSLAEGEKTDKNFLAQIHFNIGVCLYQLGENAKSVKEFEQAILLNPNYEKAFYALGMAQSELKNWEKAEQIFLTAIRLNDGNAEAWFDLAFVYLAKNEFESAKKAFQNSIQYKSVDAPVSHNNLGVILAVNGDFDSAIKEFELALQESNGSLSIAERNLRYCNSLRQNFSQNLIAKLEFGKKQLEENYGKTK